MTDTAKTRSDYETARGRAFGQIAYARSARKPAEATARATIAIAEAILALAAAVHETRPPEATPADEPEAGDPPVTTYFRGYSGRGGRTGPVKRVIHIDHTHWEDTDAPEEPSPVEEAIGAYLSWLRAPKPVGAKLTIAAQEDAPPKTKVQDKDGDVWKKRRDGLWRCKTEGVIKTANAMSYLWGPITLVRWGGKP